MKPAMINRLARPQMERFRTDDNDCFDDNARLHGKKWASNSYKKRARGKKPSSYLIALGDLRNPGCGEGGTGFVFGPTAEVLRAEWRFRRRSLSMRRRASAALTGKWSGESPAPVVVVGGPDRVLVAAHVASLAGHVVAKRARSANSHLTAALAASPTTTYAPACTSSTLTERIRSKSTRVGSTLRPVVHPDYLCFIEKCSSETS
jgi:hypothetical protein